MVEPWTEKKFDYGTRVSIPVCYYIRGASGHMLGTVMSCSNGWAVVIWDSGSKGFVFAGYLREVK